MPDGKGGLRRCPALLAVLLLAGCYSPGDLGHRIYGYVDAQGRIAIEPAFLDARPYSEGLAAVRVAGGWGYIDRDGRWVIPPRYYAAASFAEGRAAVSDARRLWGYVDTTGRVVVPPQFKSASRFIDGRAHALHPDGRVLSVDRDGRVAESAIAKEHAALGDVSMERGEGESSDPVDMMDGRRLDRAALAAAIASNRVPVSVEVEGRTRVGYDDLAGRRVIEPKFEDGGPFVDGLARVRSDGADGFIAIDGSIVVPPQFDRVLLRFSRGRTLAVSGDRAWLIDVTGRRVADLGPWPWPEMQDEEGFDDLEDYAGLDDFFADGLIPWQRDGRWGYVDRDGGWAIEPRFDSAQPFQGGLASVTQPVVGPGTSHVLARERRGQLIDVRGRVVQDVGAWRIAPPDKGLLRIGTETRWGFSTVDGGRPDELPFATRRRGFAGTSFVDHRPLEFSDDRALVSRFAQHRWLLVDEQGRTRASAEMEWLEEAGDGLYAFVDDQRWGLADERLRPLSAQRFDAKPSFEDGSLAAVSVGTRSGCIDRRGRWVVEVDATKVILDRCSYRLLTAALVGAKDLQDLRAGVMDRAGRWRIPPRFDGAEHLPGPPGAEFFLLDVGEQRSLAAVTSRGWRSSTPAAIQTCEHANACFTCATDGCRRIDPWRLQPAAPVFDEIASGVATGDVTVRQGALWGYRRVSGRLSLPVEYEDIDLFHSDVAMARVLRDGRWGVAEVDTGRLVVPMRYQDLRHVGGGRFAVREGDAWGLVGSDGEVLVAPRYREIRAVRGSLLLAREDDRWVLGTIDGRTFAGPPPEWVQDIYVLTDFSERAWAALTRDARLHFIDKQTLAVRETPAPAGYQWCTTACFSKKEFWDGELGHAVRLEAAGQQARLVFLDPEGRPALPLLDGARDIGPFGKGAGPYIVEAAGKCGVVTREGRWLVPLSFDHCAGSSATNGPVRVGREACDPSSRATGGVVSEQESPGRSAACSTQAGVGPRR